MVIALRTEASFRNQYPDDTVWAQNEESILQTPGEAPSTALAGRLRQRGCESVWVTDDLEHSWLIRADFRGVRFSVRLWTFDEDGLCRCEGGRRKAEIRSEFFAILHQALLDDPLFSDLGWHREGSNFQGDKLKTPFDQPPESPPPLRKPGSAHPPPDFGKGWRAFFKRLWWGFRQI